MKRVIIIGLLFVANSVSGGVTHSEPYFFKTGDVVIAPPRYSVHTLKTEEWEGQIDALKNTITHLLEYDNRLIFEVVKMGFTIQVSSCTGEIKLIREVK